MMLTRVRRKACNNSDREADLHWFLAQLKPGGFKLATRNLARQGFETFMPFQDITRRRAGRLQADTRPIFPGFAVGDGVRVVAGPFANAIARIDALPEKDRIFVLLEMMGRQVRAMVQPRNLELL